VGPPFRPECQYRDNGEYRYDARSPNWFGFKIAERLGADRKDPKQMKVVAAILDDLIEEGACKSKRKRMRSERRESLLCRASWRGSKTYDYNP
jgi:hypothetical protein